MPAEEVAEVFFQVIEDGKVVGEVAKQVTADNGAAIAEMVEEVASAGNGVAENITAVTETVEQAGATVTTTTGLGLLTMDVGVAGAAIAPALGILAGTGLYNLTPEFWTNVADNLLTAGQTIGGKVHAFFTDDGRVAFSQSTIEIFKNAFINSGLYNMVYTVSQNVYDRLPQDRPPLPVAVTDTTQVLVQFYAGSSLSEYVFNFNKTVKVTLYYRLKGSNGFDICVMTSSDTSYRVAITFPSGVTLNYNSYASTVLGNTFQNYASTTTVTGDISTLSTSTSIEQIPTGNNIYTASNVAYIQQYGTASNTNIQPEATLPTSQPFPQTFPNWEDIPVPEYLPNPKYYPVELPYLLPNPEPAPSGGNAQQNASQDPIPNTDPNWNPDEWLRWIIEKISIPAPNPEPYPDPEPAPTPDPDPQPEPEPAPVPDPEPAEEDPVDPNPPPTPDINPVVPPVLDTTPSTKLFTVYNPTDSELDALGAYLWNASIIDELKKIWQDPLDGIILLQKVYCTPVTGSTHNIILGKLDSGVSSSIVTSQFTTINCGYITIAEDKKNVTDYSPYASVQVYLPFIGIVQLDVDEVMGAQLNIRYTIDVYTGTCIAEIYANRSPDMTVSKILYSFSGNCAQMIPLTASTAGGLLSTLASIGSAAIGVVAGGGALAAVSGATMIGHSLSHEMLHIGHSGSMSSNAGILGQRKPYLIIGRRHGYDANAYNEIYGYPCNKTIYLSNADGYTQIKAINLQSRATSAEKAEIVELLKSGVIF